jgi:hypothetical protein
MCFVNTFLVCIRVHFITAYGLIRFTEMCVLVYSLWQQKHTAHMSSCVDCHMPSPMHNYDGRSACMQYILHCHCFLEYTQVYKLHIVGEAYISSYSFVMSVWLGMDQYLLKELVQQTPLLVPLPALAWPPWLL